MVTNMVIPTVRSGVDGDLMHDLFSVSYIKIAAPLISLSDTVPFYFSV